MQAYIYAPCVMKAAKLPAVVHPQTYYIMYLSSMQYKIFWNQKYVYNIYIPANEDTAKLMYIRS